MSGATNIVRRSRWDTSTRLDKWGNPAPLNFNVDDLEVCRLLTPVQGARTPWNYQYLPSSYVAPLLKRGQSYMIDRLQQLACEPHNYLAQPEQPEVNFRDIIFSIGANGIDEVRNAGFDFRKRPLRAIRTELMSCICAASFEYGMMKHRGITLEAVKEHHEFYPDWPIFWATTPHQQKKVYLEADCGTEQFESHPENTTIDDKFEQYLSLGNELKKDALVVFVTVRESRVLKMIEHLKKTIDRVGAPHSYAKGFAFTHIPYDRFLQKIPPLSDWALTGNYETAIEPFNFLK